ncbi:MAG: hypothetical protein Q9211_005810 [Gyalolechia sp. 1 TL-2023]
MGDQTSNCANRPTWKYDLEMEEFPRRYIKGYPSLAAFIASDSYNSTAIYRRFTRLSARNLLHLQSDLMELEARQDALDTEDLQGSRLEKVSARDWQALKERAAQVSNARERERLQKRKEGQQLAYLSERRLHTTVALIDVALAAVLLFGAVCNLYYVTSEKKRLGLIAGYTAAFAACVGLMANARKSEVFAACAAYAAVLVVFVSGNLGTRDQGCPATGMA